ncbi:MAG: efflux RND transporter periplasmic adaptor subunit [bacterium]|nr:efflux RND transporter periplasmic adaptor subunit [bacterium]
MKSQPFPRRWRRLGLALALALVLICAAACSRPAADNPGEPEAAEAASSARSVVTLPVREITLRDTVRLTAEVAAWAAVTVAAETTGRIVELPAEIGDQVARDQLVARIDDATVSARHSQAEAEVAQTTAALAQAERDLERGRELAKTQDISEGDLDRLTLARDTAEPQLAAARARARLSEESLADTVVRAPFAGVVSERPVEVGTWIAPGSPVVRLVDHRRVKVRGAASQRDRARLRTGLPAEVRVEALPGLTFAGRIRLLGQEADARTGTYLVEVAVDAPRAPSGERLLPGMQGSILVEIGARPALVIPRSALIPTAAGEGVFAVGDDVARFTVPETGEITKDQVEILSGLAAGDEVVVIGQHVLEDGDQVRRDPDAGDLAVFESQAP